jgi:AbrB family looped-hinge helix DNA binding protein
LENEFKRGMVDAESLRVRKSYRLMKGSRMAIPKSKVRSKGQLTVPREVREAVHLEEGDPVEFEIVPDGILLRPMKVIDASQAWFWTPSWQKGEEVASADIRSGRTTVHASNEDFLAALTD